MVLNVLNFSYELHFESLYSDKFNDYYILKVSKDYLYLEDLKVLIL